MAILALLEGVSPITFLLSTSSISLFALAVYRAYLHPLSAVPGPFICRLTSLWMYWHSYIGDECTAINELHATYGPVIRIGPNEVCISDGAALAPIYSEKGGFLKASQYRSFDFEGHPTIFSAIDPQHRAVRSKAVLPLFSTSSIRNGNDAIEGCVNKFVQRIKKEADVSRQAKQETGRSQPVNVLNITRSLALDAISAYLFGRSFGGVDEETDKMSATGYVDMVVAFGRFFFLPTQVFRAIEKLQQWLLPGDQDAQESAEKVGSFVEGLIDKPEKNDSYQARLKTAGLSRQEIRIQCEDVIFAGTDSTGMNMSMLCWYLTKHPDVYAKLRDEITASDNFDPNRNPQTLPYLEAVIKESLRLAMANPTRLPRTVPPHGFDFTDSTGNSYRFPPSTQIGVQIYTLHTNPKVFPDPFTFKPERWLDSATLEMQRDWIPFGLGQRQCIARNLATQELFLLVRALVRENALAGARPIADKIELLEWFNSKVVGERIELIWE